MAGGSLEAVEPHSSNVARHSGASTPLTQRLRSETNRIAAELLEEGKRAAGGTWIWQGPTGYGTPGFPFKYRRLNAHLYDGFSGVALFFAAFSKVFPEDDLSQVALGALNPLRRTLSRPLADPEAAAKLNVPLGAFVGFGSFIYSLLQVGKLLDNSELIDEAHSFTALITPERIHSDRRTRVQTGSAGAVLAMLALHQERPEANREGLTPLDLAIACGEHLLAERRAFEEGGPRVWLLADGKPALPGFCYGASGAAYALTQLHRATERQDFLDAAQEAMEFVDSLWVPEQRSWRDIRPYFEAQYETPEQGWRDWWSTGTVGPLTKRQDGPAETEDRYPRMWCHGSSGMVLGRLAALSVDDSPAIREKIEASLTSTCEIWKPGNFEVTRVNDLCCGHAGHVELLNSAYRYLGNPEYLENAHKLVESMLDHREEKGSYDLSATRGKDVFAPSLFQGLAGIAYTYLRLLAPDSVPNVLILEA